MGFIRLMLVNVLVNQWKGTSTPHILDLLITNDESISDIEYQSPVGKSNHCVLKFDYNCYAILQEKKVENFLHAKADFDALKMKLIKLAGRKK